MGKSFSKVSISDMICGKGTKWSIGEYHDLKWVRTALLYTKFTSVRKRFKGSSDSSSLIWSLNHSLIFVRSDAERLDNVATRCFN